MKGKVFLLALILSSLLMVSSVQAVSKTGLENDYFGINFFMDYAREKTDVEHDWFGINFDMYPVDPGVYKTNLVNDYFGINFEMVYQAPPTPKNPITWDWFAITFPMLNTNRSLIADFSFNVTDWTVNFTDTSIAVNITIDFWNWNFGDGFTSTSENPTHAYLFYEDLFRSPDTTPFYGIHPVTLEVENTTYNIIDSITYNIIITDPTADDVDVVFEFDWTFIIPIMGILIVIILLGVAINYGKKIGKW